MAKRSRVTGLNKVLNNLNSQITRIEGAAMAGLYEAGLGIEAVAKKRAPIEFNNLRPSGYTRRVTDGSAAVEVGFTEAYAVYVHEDLEANHPRGGQAKYLQSAVDDNRERIVEIIKRRAKLK